MLGGFIFAFLAGTLSILSPCVLPLVPVVLGRGPASPRTCGTRGWPCDIVHRNRAVRGDGRFSIGLDGGVLRGAAAVLMLLIGAVLAVPSFHARSATSAGPVGNWVDQRFGGFSSTGPGGQFGVGLLLGAVWSPFVGPTLGAASVLAARGENLVQVALTMAIFRHRRGGSAFASGGAFPRDHAKWRGHIASTGGWLKTALGIVLIVVSAAIPRASTRRSRRLWSRHLPPG